MSIQQTIPLSPDGGCGWCIEPAALRCADIIVTNNKNDLTSNLIRIGTFSDVSHALVYIDGGQVVEALTNGVAQGDLEDSLKGATLAVAYRHIHMTPARGAQIKKYLVAQATAGLKYDWWGAILSPVGGHGEDPTRFFCSELVFEAYKQAGLEIYPRPDREPPSAVVQAYHAHQLRYVGHLKEYERLPFGPDALPADAGALIALVQSPQARRAITQAFERWEAANRSITFAMIAGVHRIPATTALIVYLAGLSGNPLAGILAAAVAGPSVLELIIRQMAAHYQRKGRLPEATYRHFEELVKAVDKAKSRAGAQRVLVHA